MITTAFALLLSAAPPVTLEGNTLVLEGPIVFETGGAGLKPESDEPLDAVKQFLDDKTYISTLRIEGHTSSQGKDDFNQALSEKRALAVTRWLVSKGVDCKRLLPVGFGENKPVADNATDEGRAQNSRITFVNAALRGRAIGGMPLDGGGLVAGDPCRK